MPDESQTSDERSASDDDGNGTPRWRRWLPWVVGPLVVVGLFFGIRWWIFASNHASTDDAYVEATTAFVSSRISGKVVEVLVGSQDRVESGDLLVRLDPTEYQVALEKAQAELARARSKLEAAQASVTVTRGQTGAQVRGTEAGLTAAQRNRDLAAADLEQRRAEVRAAAADHEKAQQDVERIRSLYDRGGVAEHELDQAVNAVRVAEARLQAARAAEQAQAEQVAAAEQQVEAARAALEAARTGNVSTRVRELEADTLQAEVHKAEAELAQARLDLEHTEITAAITGFVSRKSVEAGNYVQPGQPLMAIVPLDEVWVEANFKEDEVGEIRIGQAAEIVADTYPDHTFVGHVDSLSAGTGDAFSLLPPVNATGNWIKVTRRIPVKIVLDEPPPEDFPLRVGMSTTVTIDTRDQSGPRLPRRSTARARDDADSRPEPATSAPRRPR